MNRVKIMDFLSRKQVYKYYKLYHKTQWYSKSEMEAFQILKLKKLLKHCYDNVPYYRAIIEKNQIDIKNFDSITILSKFPLLTKEIIQANYKDFIPKNNKKIAGIKISQTGGTTGNILIKRNDANTRSSIWGAYKRYEEWMGNKKSGKILKLMGGHLKKSKIKQKIREKLVNFLRNTISINIYDTSDETVEKIIQILKAKNISHIRSYPQFLYNVAQKLEQKGLSFFIKSISTTAEPLMPEHRMLFKKVFNASTFDQYGGGEIGGIAFECDKHEGLHIAEERAIVEINELNELIISDLDNYTMPFIRYWNADQAIISDKKCSCGRQSQLITQIMGRTCDYVIGINGQFLHWAYFWHLVFDSNIAKTRNLRKFQIVQNTKTAIMIRLIADKLSFEEEDFIVSDIKKRLGEIIIEFSYEQDIENTKTGKYRPVINKLL